MILKSHCGCNGNGLWDPKWLVTNAHGSRALLRAPALYGDRSSAMVHGADAAPRRFGELELVLSSDDDEGDADGASAAGPGSAGEGVPAAAVGMWVADGDAPRCQRPACRDSPAFGLFGSGAAATAAARWSARAVSRRSRCTSISGSARACATRGLWPGSRRTAAVGSPRGRSAATASAAARPPGPERCGAISSSGCCASCRPRAASRWSPSAPGSPAGGAASGAGRLTLGRDSPTVGWRARCSCTGAWRGARTGPTASSPASCISSP